MIHSEPRVFIIGRPAVDFKSIDEFLNSRRLTWLRSANATTSAELIEVAGRICYLSFKKDPTKVTLPTSKYVANLISNQHESVLEHAVWTFILDRVSRSFTHQLVRHRIGFSFSQLSQQYHEETEADVIAPAELSDYPELKDRWAVALGQIQSIYKDLLQSLKERNESPDREKMRAIRSTARSVLPNAIETAIVVTANARSLRNFLDIRGSILGDSEMRQVSVKLYKALSAEAPELFQDFAVDETADGIGAVRKVRGNGQLQ